MWTYFFIRSTQNSWSNGVFIRTEISIKESARRKGQAEGITKVAGRMLKLGMSLENIVQSTGLSLEDIRLLQEKD